MGCGGQTGSHTKGVDWCLGQKVWGSHSGMRLECRTGLLWGFLTFPHTYSDPQETQLLLLSDFESPYQLGSLQVRPDLD